MRPVIREFVDRVTGELKPCDPGKEYPDPTPIELPLDYKRPLSLREEMALMIREEASRLAEQAGMGSFEDEDDFRLDDDQPGAHELDDEQLTGSMDEFEKEVYERDRVVDNSSPADDNGDADNKSAKSGDDRGRNPKGSGKSGNVKPKREDDSRGGDDNDD